jgi:alpha-tubulin suppressor-like RCC1 family protein
VGAGETLTCALKTSGTVWCWGQGPVGDGTAENRPLPAMVAGLSSVTDIAVGRWHACARKADRTVWCWGRNAMGQVDASMSNRLAPVQITAVATAQAVAAAGRFSCALSDGGNLVCWGDRPILPVGDSHAVEISIGDAHACYRTADRTVWCLGNNNNGEFGNGMTGGSTRIPVMSMMSNATALDLGGFLTLSLKQDGTVWWWGWDTVAGKTPIPARIAGVDGAVSISAGQQHNCAVASSGAAWCWGLGSNGRLGNGGTASSATPVPVALTGATQISAGDAHTCAVLKNGPLQCWGYNNVGQLGTGTTSESTRPTAVRLGCP